MSDWRTIVHHADETARLERLAAELGISPVAAECYEMAKHYHQAHIMAERASLPVEAVWAGLKECRHKGLVRHRWLHRPADMRVVWYRPDLQSGYTEPTRREQRLRYLAFERRVLLGEDED